MILRGVLEKSFGSFMCLRGFCKLGELARHSMPDPNYQRPAIDEHIGEMVDFLNDHNNLFFPEVILGVSLEEFGISEREYNWLYTEALTGVGVSRKKMGDLVVSIFAKKFSSDDGRPWVHNTASFYGITADDSHKMRRIDGNHRLEAALRPEVTSYVLDRQIPFCLILFRDNKQYRECASTFFRNINFKVRPILEEYNLKIVLDDKETFSDALLVNNPAYGKHFVWARKLLVYLKDNPSSILTTVVKDSIRTFLIKTLEIVASENVETVLSRAVISDDEFSCFVKSIESVFDKLPVSSIADNLSIAETLAYYKIIDNAGAHGEYERFCAWFQKNNFSRIKKIEAKEIVSIFNEVNKGLPKKLFLARWYPKEGEEKRKADARYSAMESIARKNNLTLVDMEHIFGGTFSIRDMIDKELPESDLFVADLTGARPNVMIEVGMALHHIKKDRVLFFFQPSNEVPSVPFDISGFRYESIVDSSEILSKVEPNIKRILDSLL